MVRRSKWITFGLVAALSIVLLAVLAARPQVPYKFLVGHAPNSPQSTFEHQSGAGPVVLVPGSASYTWREDPETVVRVAAAELVRKGFEQRRDGDVHRFFRARSGVYDAVLIWPRMKGGVAVEIYTNDNPSLWDRIKAVFGL